MNGSENSVRRSGEEVPEPGNRGAMCWVRLKQLRLLNAVPSLEASKPSVFFYIVWPP